MYADSITRPYVTDESRTRILLSFGADSKSAVYTISTTVTQYLVRLSLVTEAIWVVTTFFLPLITSSFVLFASFYMFMMQFRASPRIRTVIITAYKAVAIPLGERSAVDRRGLEPRTCRLWAGCSKPTELTIRIMLTITLGRIASPPFFYPELIKFPEATFAHSLCIS